MLALLVIAAVLKNAYTLRCFSSALSGLLLLHAPYYKWGFPPEDELYPL